MIQLQWLQQKMKLVLKDYTKIAIWCGELFWCRKWATFWLMGGTFPHPQGFQQRFGERGKAVDTLWRQQSKIKEGEIFRKKEDAGRGGGYNSGKWSCWTLFCIKGFNSNEIFQISHDCETKNAYRRKHFGEICVKTLEIPFVQLVLCDQGRDGVRHEGKGEDSILWRGVISNRRAQDFVYKGGIPISPLMGLILP